MIRNINFVNGICRKVYSISIEYFDQRFLIYQLWYLKLDTEHGSKVLPRNENLKCKDRLCFIKSNVTFDTVSFLKFLVRCIIIHDFAHNTWNAKEEIFDLYLHKNERIVYLRRNKIELEGIFLCCQILKVIFLPNLKP